MKALEKFKDESNGRQFIEFCGIAAKLYSLLLKNQEQKHVAKGIKNSAKNRMSHNDYYRCLFPTQSSDERQFINFHCIRSKSHKIHTYEMRKVAMCRYDDKRYILDDGITSYSYGHKNIPKI